VISKIQTTAWRPIFADREDVHSSAVTMLQLIGCARSRKAVRTKARLERLEIRNRGYHNYNINIVGLTERSRAQEKFGDQGTHDSESKPELA
jgi:hypothetical protein